MHGKKIVFRYKSLFLIFKKTIEATQLRIVVDMQAPYAFPEKNDMRGSMYATPCRPGGTFRTITPLLINPIRLTLWKRQPEIVSGYGELKVRAGTRHMSRCISPMQLIDLKTYLQSEN